MTGASSLAARCVAWLLRALGATWRIEVRGTDPLAPGLPPSAGALWHESLLIAAYCFRGRGIRVAVSRSRDGARIAAVLAALGFGDSPRGSSSRGGAAALRGLVRCVDQGATVAVLTDGPRGPARQSKPGIVGLARAAGCPIVPVTIRARPVLRFGSWDRTLLPLPFARVRVRYGEPIRVPPDLARDEEPRLLAQIDSELARSRSAKG